MPRICISLILLCLMASQSSATRIRSSVMRRNSTIASGKVGKTVGKSQIFIISAVGAAVGAYCQAFATAHPVITGIGTFALFIESLRADVRMHAAIEHQCRVAALQGVNEGARRDAQVALGPGRGARTARAQGPDHGQASRGAPSPGQDPSMLQIGEMIHAASDKPAEKEAARQMPRQDPANLATAFAVDTDGHEQVFGDGHGFEDANMTGPMTPDFLGPLTRDLAFHESGLRISDADPVVLFDVDVQLLGNINKLLDMTDLDIIESIAMASEVAFGKLREELQKLLRKDTPVVELVAETADHSDHFQVALRGRVFQKHDGLVAN